MKKYLLYVSQLYSFSIAKPLNDFIIGNGDKAAWFIAKPEYKKYLHKNAKVLHTIWDVIEYNPCAVFVASNTVPDFFPGIKVQLFHGFNAQKRNSAIGHFRIRGFFDLYCTQGPSTTLPFLELEKKHGFFKVIETGWPKMDPLFSEKTEQENKRPIILFTSTFTPSLSAAYRIHDILSDLINKNTWDWRITLHPKMAPGIVAKYKKLQQKNCKFIETDNTIPLLKKADVMLSDTSSIISEFLLQEKPVVTFKNRRPGNHLINIQDQADIEKSIKKALEKPDDLMDSIKKYIDLIHPYKDGKSSERVVNASNIFIDNYYKKLKNKPLNLTRRLKMRLKYHYYRL